MLKYTKIKQGVGFSNLLHDAYWGIGSITPEAEQVLYEVLGTLTEREQKVLKLRYGLDSGEGMYMREVGEIEGVSSQMIGYIVNKALRKLNHPSRSRRVRPYLIWKEEL